MRRLCPGWLLLTKINGVIELKLLSIEAELYSQKPFIGVWEKSLLGSSKNNINNASPTGKQVLRILGSIFKPDFSSL